MKTITTTPQKSGSAAEIESFDDFDALGSSLNFVPSVNIRETGTNYEIELAASGFKRSDFTISTDDGNIIIGAEKSSRHIEEKEDFTRKEFTRTAFSRSFKLPENVIQDKITANYHGGLLRIHLKKADSQSSSQQKIRVK